MTSSWDYYTASFDHSGADKVRWFDQKVTSGNLAEVASAVKSVVMLKNLEWFNRIDVQGSRSLDDTVQREYGKPSLADQSAANEYDKFIAQNLNVLAFAGVLESKLSGSRNREYRIKNSEVLDKIADSDKESRIFLIAYLFWVLNEFAWWSNIERYLKSNHTQADMDLLKNGFTKLLIDTMGLGSRGGGRPEVEAGRIFAKVINLIAYWKSVPGIQGGRVMKDSPSRFELTYNRPNWRDSASRKPKRVTRKSYLAQLELDAAASATTSQLSKAKRQVRDYQKGVSEVSDATGVRASHIHHIFPVHLFPTLADVLENLIALTPGQHLGQAHPHGNTSAIDPVFQRTCLISKLNSIKRSVDSGDGMYSYQSFAMVLDTGWNLKNIDPDFDSLRQAIIDQVV